MDGISAESLPDGLMLLEPRDEWDGCIIGTVRRFNDQFVLYSRRKVIAKLMRDFHDSEDPYMDAIEWFEFNIVGAWVGDTTPGFLEDDE